ncbi:hypothetical protein Ga0061061_104211 [Chelatococcus sambhunathii]|uniref:Surface antigen domain-containing protein n=1 Tax=Chelatococcus sambhunathii TaxID=363953 RepID=A0ABP2A368_9HYPH|nr:hypothetical protein Ga0061061_104211 [Chelatococcus sambhunathii]
MTRGDMRSSYKRTASLCEGIHAGRGVARAAALVAALAAGGCSISFPLGSLVGEDVATTSSVAPAPSPLSPELTAEDWRRARSALEVALDPFGNGTSASWDNPETGVKGAFLPLGQPYVKDGDVCRAFLADLSLQVGAQAMQGTACRPSGGGWSITEVKPWRKPA